MAKKESSKNEDKGKKPKKSVGRPKKRGRKKNYYKAKKKATPKSKVVKPKQGFSSNITYNRVRHILWLNYKDDFPSYRAFISNEVDENGKRIHGTSIVSKVFNQCKSLECNDDDILAIYRQYSATDKGEAPDTLDNYYFVPTPYWELLTNDFWTGMDERLWVYAPMLLTSPSAFLGILGSDRIVDKEGNPLGMKNYDPKDGDRIVKGKAMMFQNFVNYCNDLQLQKINIGTDEQPHFRFMGKEDGDEECYWNETENRWEIQIVICDNTGEIHDYDFIPSNIDTGIDKELIKKLREKAETEPSPIDKKKDKESEVEEKIVPKDKEEASAIKKLEAELELEKEKTKQKLADVEKEKATAKIEEEKTKQKLADIEIQKANLKIIDLFIAGKISEDTMNKLLK